MKKKHILSVALAFVLMVALVSGNALAMPLARPYQGAMDKAAKASTRVLINPALVQINVGQLKQLTATVSGARGGEVLWRVERGEAFGSVDENGVVTGIKPGAVYVRATDPVTGQYATRKVTVKAVRITSLRLPKTSVVIDQGESFSLGPPTILPANATVTQVKWSSANASKVSVDDKGVVTGVSAGTTRITCTVGTKKATCTVRVRGNSTTVTLSAAGDVILGGDPEIKSALNRSTEEVFKNLITQYGTGYPFKNVAKVFQEDDVSIVNFEGTLTTAANQKKKTHSFRGDPSYAQMLVNAGIEVVTLANNHALDFKQGGLNDTRSAMNRVGVKWCDFTENATYTVEKDGLTVKIGFAGFQTPALSQTITKRVKELKRKCDVVVVSFHWCDTKEWKAMNFPSSRNRAKAAINAGADLVLGHHRHVPSGIETYKGKYIVHDLSNFVVGIKHKLDPATGRPLTDTFIFQWTFQIDSLGIIEDMGIKVIPATTTTSTETYPATDDFGNEGAPVNNFQPALLTGQEGRDVISRIQALSTVRIPTE